MRPLLNPLQAVRKLLGRDDLPPGFTGTLEPDERVLAGAVLAGGGHVVVTSWGLWLPNGRGFLDGEAYRRVGWHLVSKATWGDGALMLVEADEQEVLGGAVLLADRAPRRLRLDRPGGVPQAVHERVTSSIRTRNHRELPGGGVWFVQRKVPGRDGFVLQVRPDPGTDAAAVRQLATDVAAGLGLGP